MCALMTEDVTVAYGGGAITLTGRQSVQDYLTQAMGARPCSPRTSSATPRSRSTATRPGRLGPAGHGDPRGPRPGHPRCLAVRRHYVRVDGSGGSGTPATSGCTRRSPRGLRAPARPRRGSGPTGGPPLSESFVRVEKPRPHVSLVTLDRPERMNAMAFDVMVPLRETLEAIASDNDVRVVVLTGEGRAFCAGADLVDAGYPPGIDGLALPEHRPALDEAARGRRHDGARDAPASHRCCQRRGHRRGLLPCRLVRHPDRSRGRLLPGRRHQQRPHRLRARAVLPAPPRHRLVTRLRDHADRPGRQRDRGRSHRLGVAPSYPTGS